ncbi:hypothetical protein CTAYLR_002526 [Chrysophaeum taylorii]|uniref:Glycosyltransferase n=1 Tax=Chrysophaeum taylorii TaxID=2483200 RepID=A0AAD7XLC5_9STRA|nr:hypothetical protein CTAYLR_002526 [Chrysophaeum taylorii]
MLLLLVSAEAIVCCKVASFRGCDEHKETYNSELCSLLTTKCELRCPRREEPMSLGTPIPNVLHQMWKTTALPGAFHYTVSTMLRTHPHWHYVFWTDEDLPGLFVAHAEKVGINFNKFGLTGIQTSDVARYLIMFVYGGFYADLDMESLRPLDALLGSSIVLGREPDAHAYFLYNGRQRLTCNAILGSKPTEGFWLVVLLNLKAVRSTNAVGTTGPLRLDEIVSEFGYDRYVLNASFFYPLMGPFAKEKMRHYCMMFAKRSDVPASKKATNNSSSSSRVVNLGKLGSALAAAKC